jgi:hypothetical protein
MIKIMIDTKHALNALLATQKQVRFAASKALNNIAFKAMRDGRAHVQANLNNPTPWTVKAWYVRKKATKADLVAAVGWSDYLSNKRGHAAEYYLGQHWTGGGRKQKAYESHMQRSGLLPAGHFTVPGAAAKEMKMLDARGNFKGGAIVAIMSALGAFDQRGFTANATARQSKKRSANKSASKQVYWAGKPGKNTPNGIWALDEKFGKGRGRLRPIMVFVSRANYRKRLDLDKIAAQAVATFDIEFKREMANAIATAR